MKPPTSQAASTTQGERKSASRNPLVVNTPVPIMLATTSAVALPRPSWRGAFILRSERLHPLQMWRKLMPLSFGFRVPRHGHKAHGQDRLFRDLPGFLPEKVQLLISGRAHWNDHSPVLLELLHQGLRDVLRGASDDDRVEGRRLRPAF